MGLELLSLFSDLSLGTLKIHAEPGQDAILDRVALSIDGLILKNPRTKGILIESLRMKVENFNTSLSPTEALLSSTITIDKMRVKIAQSFFNDLVMQNRDAYEPKGIRDVEIVLLDRKIIVRGSLKKGASFPFSVEIKTKADKNKLVVKLSHFNLMEMLPLPGWLQDILLDIAMDKLNHPFIEVKEHHDFYIDVMAALPFPVKMDIKDFRVEKDALVLELEYIEKAEGDGTETSSCPPVCI
ncbi:MAG: hypothetical protein AB2L14_08590 [Candidatus Xenobiia bacterium LiM19]